MKSNKFREFGQTMQDRDAPVVPIYVTEGSGAIVVIAITLFSVVVMYVTSRNSDSAWSSIWGTVIFFSIALPTGLMAANGTFGAMFRVWQEQRTIVILNRPDARHHTLEVVQPPQLPYEGSASPVALPQSPNFVSPYAEVDDSVMREAKAWLVQLYTKDGKPDPSKVLMESDTEKPGRIRIKGPSRPAKQYLLDRGIIHDLGNGYRLNMPRCSTILGAQNNLERTPVPGGSPTPHYQGGGYPPLHWRGGRTMITVLGVLALIVLVVFSQSKSKIDDAYAQNAIEAEAQNKNPVQPIGGNSSYEAGCMTIVVIVVAFAAVIALANILPPGVLLPR